MISDTRIFVSIETFSIASKFFQKKYSDNFLALAAHGVGLDLADWLEITAQQKIVRVLLTKRLEIGGPQGIVQVFSENKPGHNAYFFSEYANF